LSLCARPAPFLIDAAHWPFELRRSCQSEDGVDDFGQRAGDIDADAVPGLVFSAFVQGHDDGALGGLGAPFVDAGVDAALQRSAIQFEQEDGVQQVDELMPVARATAEEGLVMALVGDDGEDLVKVPDVVIADELKVAGWRGRRAPVSGSP
jgi:hypothetical protein